MPVNHQCFNYRTMNYYVFYQDGYCDNGDVGLDFFDTEKEAVEFVEKRIRRHEEPSIKNYIVIKGEEMTIEIIEKVKSIRLK